MLSKEILPTQLFDPNEDTYQLYKKLVWLVFIWAVGSPYCTIPNLRNKKYSAFIILIGYE